MQEGANSNGSAHRRQVFGSGIDARSAGPAPCRAGTVQMKIH
jgi:hypothetical protein